MNLYIKYMVSIRCRMIVKSELDKLGLCYGAIGLGEIEMMGDVTVEQRIQLKSNLLQYGLEVMDDKKSMLVEKIKYVIEEMVHCAGRPHETKNSNYISSRLNIDYAYLSNFFSEAAGITIEQFIISKKIELVKQLLLHGGYNLTEISHRLNYSSVAHLCSQFKKTTGITPSYYKKLHATRHNHLKNV